MPSMPTLTVCPCALPQGSETILYGVCCNPACISDSHRVSECSDALCALGAEPHLPVSTGCSSCRECTANGTRSSWRPLTAAEGEFLSIGAVASTSLRVSPTAHTTQVPSHPTQDHAVHRAIVCLPPRPVCPVDPADLCSMQIFHICIGDIERQGSPPNLQVRMLSRLCPSLIYEHALHHSPLTATSSPLTYRFRAAPFVDPRVRSYRGAKAYLPDVQIESADERFKVHRLKTRLACIANMLSAGTHVPPGSAGAIVSLLRERNRSYEIRDTIYECVRSWFGWYMDMESFKAPSHLANAWQAAEVARARGSLAPPPPPPRSRLHSRSRPWLVPPPPLRSRPHRDGA
jgi:hypothetical protein